MPKVKRNEKINDYLTRCIPIVSKEHPELSHKAVVGRCAGMFRGKYGLKTPAKRKVKKRVKRNKWSGKAIISD